MSDESKYSLGRGGKKPDRWEDLPEQTRAEIVESMVAVRENLIEQMQPVLEQLAATVWPALQRFSEVAASIDSAARLAADITRQWVPNWSGDVDQDKAWALTVEGIPLAFVPREQIVDQLIAAEDRDARLDLVLRSKKLILDDCRDSLQRSDDDLPFPVSISMLQTLLLEVFDVVEAGYASAACALGVSVIDSLLRRTTEKNFNYNRVRATSISTELQEAIAANEFRVCLATQPLHSLLEEWNPKKRTPVPLMPSRHVVAHWATPEHLSETNAIIIAMAATSLFLGLAEREWVAGRIRTDHAGSGD